MSECTIYRKITLCQGSSRCDNCLTDYNPDQNDFNNDGGGDVCDSDIDGDEIINILDQCPKSDTNEAIIIDNCDTLVSNQVLSGILSNGCFIADEINQCSENIDNHGDFVSCVADVTNDLKSDGIISSPQKFSIQKCAAQVNMLPVMR